MIHAQPDKSNGYEPNAEEFMRRRNQRIGVATVREWARSLPKGCAVLELCRGFGEPISQVLMDEGLDLYVVDASPKMITAFRNRFPSVLTECCPAEDSQFFDRTFDAAMAWGLMFLLPADVQPLMIAKVAGALNPGGHFLFTAPKQPQTWVDVLTRLESVSLGQARYEEILRAEGLEITADAVDEGENYYYLARSVRWVPALGTRHYDAVVSFIRQTGRVEAVGERAKIASLKIQTGSADWEALRCLALLAFVPIAHASSLSQHRSEPRDEARTQRHSARVVGKHLTAPTTISGTARLASVTKTGASAAALRHDGHSRPVILTRRQAPQQAPAPAMSSTTLFR